MIRAGSIAGIIAGTIRGMDYAQNYVVAAKDYGRVAEFAQKYGFEKACGSYEEPVEDAEVELVYITTPYSHCYEHIKLRLNHGKHILCKKSFTINESQAREVPELVREKKLLLTKATQTRRMSIRKTLDDVLLSGIIGGPYMSTVSLDYIVSGKERIVCPELAGGALLGVGTYPLSFASMVFRDEVDTITGTAVMTEAGADAQNNITITYRNGRTAILCSNVMELSNRRSIIYGDSGLIEVEGISDREGIRIYDRSRDMIASYDTPKQINGYEYKAEACLRAIEEGVLECLEMPHEETLRMTGWMDELRRQ